MSTNRSYLTVQRNSLWPLMHRSMNDLQNGPSWISPTPCSKELHLIQLNSAETARAKAIKKWSAKNDTRSEGRKNKPISGYSWSFSPDKFEPPPQKPTKGQFFNWGLIGTEPLNQCGWLRSHKHGLEFMSRFFDLVFK